MMKKENKKSLRKVGRISNLLMLFAVASTVLCLPMELPAADKPIILKAVTAFGKNNVAHKGIPPLIDMVKKESQGRLIIKWIGGPEVVKAFDQPESLRSGMIDMLLYIPTGYFKPILPVAEARGLSQMTGPEERQSGAFTLWKEVFRKYCNAEHLGFWATSIQFQVYTIDKIASLADFKGKTIRAMPLYVPFIKALGASPVMMPPPEVYTALQRKVVDGFMWLEMGVTPFAWHEQINYMLFPAVFRGEATVAVNLDKFQSLPKDLQDVLNRCMEKMEIEGDEMLLGVLEEERAIMKKKGVQAVHLSQEEGKKFKQLSQDVTWEEVIKRAPDYGPKFKELTRK